MFVPKLLHYTLDPTSRLVRLMCAEYGKEIELVHIKAWRREQDFLDVSPAGEVPVLDIDDQLTLVGASAVIYFVEEQFGTQPILLPTEPVLRAETRRLVDWALNKFSEDVSRYIIEEKFIKNDRPGGTPDTTVLRAARANLTEHLSYFNYLLATRRWLAGDEMSMADFALAAQLSSLDYLSEVPWATVPEVKDWYQRLKSRPAFRSLLLDRVVGMPASSTYADIDF
ncbi:glutathione S-transferase family protein [Maritalea sp.]|jgi:glutathione S-transferase|uniref:glutathione S-transferase family protein n=1 Tax=Maritalea sp. TaxID=2003361 RepID=UPI0039E518CF